MSVKPKQTMAQNKLLVLYLLYKANMELSELQLMRIAGELGFMGYFDLKECLFELTQNNHIMEETTPQGMWYGLTDTGRRMLEVLMNDLRLSFRRAADEYLERNKKALMKESQLTGEYIKLREGEYRVILKVLEKNVAAFEINLIVSTRAEAQQAVEKWKENAAAVYEDVILKLH